VVADWWRERGHTLGIGDLYQALRVEHELLIVGTGHDSRMKVPDETRKALIANGADLMLLPTGEACERYNALAPKRAVIAALHLTC
jgi:hypothetical protein